jgi:hypothetical protein
VSNKEPTRTSVERCTCRSVVEKCSTVYPVASVRRLTSRSKLITVGVFGCSKKYLRKSRTDFSPGRSAIDCSLAEHRKSYVKNAGDE